jgi:hypothetical protein
MAVNAVIPSGASGAARREQSCATDGSKLSAEHIFHAQYLVCNHVPYYRNEPEVPPMKRLLSCAAFAKVPLRLRS